MTGFAELLLWGRNNQARASEAEHCCRALVSAMLQPLAQDKALAADLWKASCAAVGWDDGTKQAQQGPG